LHLLRGHRDHKQVNPFAFALGSRVCVSVCVSVCVCVALGMELESCLALVFILFWDLPNFTWAALELLILLSVSPE
jgi:hypothetical protein